jgi:hypothetical protein|nr:MAG TPA: hypothetical protein [Caudoviricetes sp.]
MEMRTAVGIVTCIVLMMDIYCRAKMTILDDELEDEQSIIEIILLMLMCIGIFLSL